MTACGSCIVRTEGTVTFGTHYCGKVCQEAHWKDHRDYCKALQQLHRLMSMFDQVYSLVLELATDPCSQPIKMCKKAGLIIVQSPTKEMERAFGYQGKHVLRGVPDASALYRELKIAAMMRHHCLDIMEGGMALLEYFLGFGFRNLKILSLQPKNVQTPLVVTKGTSLSFLDLLALCTHTVFRVTLPGKVQVVIDITRHQHGWKEFIAPWDKYEQHRVQFVDDRGGFPFMQHAKQTTELESLNEVLEHSRLKADKAGGKNHARPAIPVCLTRSLESHIDEKFGGLQALLETKDDVFREGQETIIAAARRWLRNGITSFKRRQDYKYYISPDTKSLEISVGLEFSKKLKNVWLSNEEYEKHIHSPKDSPGNLEEEMGHCHGEIAPSAMLLMHLQSESSTGTERGLFLGLQR